ncbi:acyl-CoA dehydrogenase family protein [uncultured Corynebacterium sp.]|uniref:acyl-CoA dehydrogenase family protein n=1 Tax=uncultured Corynebacterium sp. TaxID=159447 RepID=UPI0025F846B8|nr:acyl-CoA dehydrogenase family protein [uncultured Corynebacterium sp.]
MTDRSTLPLPGSGDTAARFLALWAGCRADVSEGRLAEADHDADAILAEIGDGRRVADGEFWGVWAAEPPSPVLEARRTADSDLDSDPRSSSDSDGWLLDGVKPWCSGIGRCTHALVTARVDGRPRLFAVDLRHPGVSGSSESWVNAGMADTATGEVAFDSVPAVTVGGPRDYLDRPGFWHGGVGVAACWLGGVSGLCDVLADAARRRSDPHVLAHLGAVDALLTTGRWLILGAAAEIDADPGDAAAARIRALRVRTMADRICADVLDHVGRALGAGPLAHDQRVAERIADVAVYSRQSHAERDEAWLGELLVADSSDSEATGS